MGRNTRKRKKRKGRNLRNEMRGRLREQIRKRKEEIKDIYEREEEERGREEGTHQCINSDNKEHCYTTLQCRTKKAEKTELSRTKQNQQKE